MTVTDKDAKDWQKMVDKLEKQNKKNVNEASIASFFKSCLSPKEREQLEVVKKYNKVLDFKDKK